MTTSGSWSSVYCPCSAFEMRMQEEEAMAAAMAAATGVAMAMEASEVRMLPLSQLEVSCTLPVAVSRHC